MMIINKNQINKYQIKVKKTTKNTKSKNQCK